MKVLILDEWIPFPLDSGKKLRTYNLVKHLSQFHQITYLCYHHQETPDKMELPNVRFIGVAKKRTRKGSIWYYFRVLLNLLKAVPFSAEYAYSKEFQDKLDETVNTMNPDIIICEWTPYASFLSKITHSCKILMAHNVEYLQWQRMFDASSNPIKKVLYKNQMISMQWFEAKYFPQFHTIVAVSEHDKNLIQTISPNTNTIVVENGVDLEYFHPQDYSGEKNIIYTASMDAFCNQDAVIHCCKNIFPLLRKRMPAMTFYVVGRNPNKAVLNLARFGGVVVTGSVDDIRPYIARSSVFVVPILAGGGTRLKILEAMAMGIPIVSTSIGAEGLEVTNHKNILIADNEEQFAEYVVECIQNKQLRDKLVSNSYDLINRVYTWDIIGNKLSDYLDNIDLE